jgi:hypothetical protein
VAYSMKFKKEVLSFCNDASNTIREASRIFRISTNTIFMEHSVGVTA